MRLLKKIQIGKKHSPTKTFRKLMTLGMKP